MQWISVKERLPDNKENVVVMLANDDDYALRKYATGYRDECNCFECLTSCPKNEWIINHAHFYLDLEERVTHWMPLPKGADDELD